MGKRKRRYVERITFNEGKPTGQKPEEKKEVPEGTPAPGSKKPE